MIIAFPGTRTDQMLGTVIIDVAEDASMFGSDDGGFSNSIGMENVLVHNGFAKEIMEFWKNMMVYVGKHTNYNEVYFIGHSKGGGMALLTALKYVCENSIPKGSNFVKIFTFAAPAVFRGKEGYDFFHQHIDGRNTICIYKNLDIVPCLVPGYFVHVGILANISKKLESMGNIKEEVSGLGTSLAACVSSNAKTSALKVVAALTKHIASNAVKSHFLTNFSRAQIREVMERIKKNYFEDPEMDFSEMGREKSPALCVIL